MSEKEVLMKMSAVLLAVYVLYVVEFIASRGVPKRCQVSSSEEFRFFELLPMRITKCFGEKSEFYGEEIA